MATFNSKKTKIETSKEQVLGQMIFGFNSINRFLETNYQLSKIYYLASENRSGLIYQTMIRSLIKDYHNVNQFKEV